MQKRKVWHLSPHETQTHFFSHIKASNLRVPELQTWITLSKLWRQTGFATSDEKTGSSKTSIIAFFIGLVLIFYWTHNSVFWDLCTRLNYLVQFVFTSQVLWEIGIDLMVEDWQCICTLVNYCWIFKNDLRFLSILVDRWTKWNTSVKSPHSNPLFMCLSCLSNKNKPLCG